MDKDGKELITSLYRADDFLGFTSFMNNIPYQESATAIENTELASISKKDLKTILEKNHTISLEFMELLTNDITEIKAQLDKWPKVRYRKKRPRPFCNLPRS